MAACDNSSEKYLIHGVNALVRSAWVENIMINVPLSLDHKPISARHVAIYLNRAGAYHSIGMRAYYFAVPLVFWLFGPHLMLLATMVLVVILFVIDRTPQVLADDYR